jgi:hypothetical protein
MRERQDKSPRTKLAADPQEKRSERKFAAVKKSND